MTLHAAWARLYYFSVFHRRMRPDGHSGAVLRPKIPGLVPPPLQSHTKLDGASSQAVSVRRANALFAHQKRELQW